MPKKPSKIKKQDAPFTVQIELTEGCNLRCTFCGLNGIRGKENNFKFMTVDTAEELADQLAVLAVEQQWNPRLEFAMHGEPSMNPDMVEILQLFRESLPTHHMMMTSNGGGFLKDPDLVTEVLKYLNVLALDDYENVKIVPKLLKRVANKENGIEPRFYPEDKNANPHTRRRPKEHELIIVQDIQEASKGTHSVLNNHAGSGAPPNNKAEGKRCAKVFREISVRFDGSIAICCNDWRGVYKCGNILDNPLDTIWNGPEFVASRKKLYHGERDFGPCAGCDALSYRTGLLPDKFGKEELPKASEKDQDVIRKAISGKPFTLPVLREWEKGKANDVKSRIRKKKG